MRRAHDGDGDERGEIVKPLAGLSVVDAAADRAGSIAGMLLADLGAAVTRVETAAGAQRRPHPVELPDAVCWDRGKTTQMVTSLDPGADAALAALLDTANVLLLDDTPDAFDRSPLRPARTAATRADLVTVWTPPYGRHGDRYGDLPADSLLQSAVTSYAMHQPAFEPVPIAPVVPIIEAIQGALAAAAAVAGALHSAHTGEGQLATVSGVDAAGALLATVVNDTLDAEPVIRPGRKPGQGPSFRPYRCGDGQMLFLATLVAPLFLRALDALDAMDVMLVDGVDGEFVNLMRPEIGPVASAMLEAHFATRPREHWLERLAAAGVPAEPVQSRDDWIASEAFAATGGRRHFEHPIVGDVATPTPPVTFAPSSRGLDAGAVWPARSMAGSGPGPLAGLRVVDLAGFVAGPYAPSVLAHWGAQVVKVETPDGDPYRTFSLPYLAVNQAKRSAVLDLTTPDGRAALERLITDADVLVDNLRPSARAKLDLGDETLRRINPALVHASVTAFGPGPFAERPGFDPCIQAISGMMWSTGPPGRPVHTSVPVHDVAAASSLALGVLAALWQRHTTGAVPTVVTSLAAASSLLQCAELTDFEGRPATAHGDVDYLGPSPAHRSYRTADGWIAVAAASLDELAAALDRDGDGTATDVAASIEARLAQRPTKDALIELGEARVAAVEVVGASWGSDAYLEDNQLSHVVTEPTFGRCRVMRGPGAWSRSGVAVVSGMVAARHDTARLADGGWAALDREPDAPRA